MTGKNEIRSRLEILLAIDKFGPDEDLNYPGTDFVETKEELQTSLDDLISELADNVDKCSDRKYVYSLVRNFLKDKKSCDTDDCDRIALYLEEIIDILEMEGLENLLDDLRY